MKTELAVYFPQFKDDRVNGKIKMIGEGIQTGQTIDEEAIAAYSNRHTEWNETNKGFLKNPSS